MVKTARAEAHGALWAQHSTCLNHAGNFLLALLLPVSQQPLHCVPTEPFSRACPAQQASGQGTRAKPGLCQPQICLCRLLVPEHRGDFRRRQRPVSGVTRRGSPVSHSNRTLGKPTSNDHGKTPGPNLQKYRVLIIPVTSWTAR